MSSLRAMNPAPGEVCATTKSGRHVEPPEGSRSWRRLLQPSLKLNFSLMIGT